MEEKAGGKGMKAYDIEKKAYPEMTDEVIKDIKENYPTEYVCGFYEKGRYAWILEDIQPVNDIKVKGCLGLWDCDKEMIK